MQGVKRGDREELTRSKLRQLLHGHDAHSDGFQYNGEQTLALMRNTWFQNQDAILKAWRELPGPKPTLPWCARLFGLQTENAGPFKAPLARVGRPSTKSKARKKENGS